MSEPTPEEILAAADAEVRRADEQLAELEQRVLDDDPDVGPEDIEKARSLRYFAGLAKRRAEKKAAKLREKQQAALREAAFAEARQILAEATDDDVEAAVLAAGEAMARLREAVRARNDARERALRVLRACPAVERCDPQVGRLRGEELPQYPELGHGMDGARPVLWVDGRQMLPLSEREVMDRARRLPEQRDYDQKRLRQQAAMARQVEQDAALYEQDRAAFERLPAVRRKPALDRLGVDWQEYVRQREQV